MPFVIPFSVFVFFVLASLALYYFLSRPPSEASERLENLRRQGGDIGAAPVIKDSPIIKLAERVAAPINRIAPPSAELVGKLQKKLMHAGYRSPNAPMIYRAIQILTLVSFPGAMALILI